MRRHSSNLTGGDSVPASGLSNFKDELAYILMGRQAAHFTCLFNQRVSLPHACCSNITHLMSSISAVYMRLPNWIGDVCMSLPSLEAVLATGIPVIVCARGWARDLLSGFDLAGFIEMKGRWREDRATVHAYRKRAQHRHPHGLLLPDSLSSAMVFKFAGIPSAGYRDDGRSLILRWPMNKPGGALHAVQSWHHVTTQALRRWGVPTVPLPPHRRLGLPLTERHQAEALDAIAKAGLAPERFILIAPTATGLHQGKVKVWPFYDKLARHLQAQGR